jgi:hypothetical protein
MAVTRLSTGVNKVPGMLIQFTVGREFCVLERQDAKLLISELVDAI